MSARSNLSDRAVALLGKLSSKGRRAALDYIEYLADREEIVLPEEEASLREDLAAAKAARQSGYRGSLTLEQVRQQLSLK
jgi:hypothetical protein